MIAMRMMKPAVYEVIDVITMGYGFVTAIGAMRMRAAHLRRTLDRIGGVYRDDMFVDMILVHMVQMAIVQVINMAVMPNRSVAAVRTVPMSVVGMMLLGAGYHDIPPF